ncbi:hypothetical protein [Streptomyces sp. AS02]|uniref:hypothetical protein n=1 Tax=Streptomyces sp. AS02 TaxID=2938946 RepID=UPI002021BBB8|nr:hypothetical protein [Streptomyces sp. AS02]MCL8016800.1 hypothetical protein [Streptomyces sp. AS02]
MVSSGTEVENPESLKKAGNGAAEIAGETKTAGNHPVDETRAAARDFSADWSGGAGAALNRLAAVWSLQVEGLVGRCRDLSTQFGATRNNFVEVEAANTQTMKSVQPSPFG